MLTNLLMQRKIYQCHHEMKLKRGCLPNISLKIGLENRCMGVHVFGDAKRFFPNLIFFQTTYQQQSFVLGLKLNNIKKSRCLPVKLHIAKYQ